MSDPPPLPRPGPPPLPPRKSDAQVVKTVSTIIACFFGFFAVGAAILLPGLARAREAARRASCQNNLKQVGLCCKMYANEHNNTFPQTFNDLYPEYLTDPCILVCPSSTDEPGDLKDMAAWTSYEIVYTGPDDNNEETVTVQEKSEDAHIPFGRNYLFGDGHVEYRRANVVKPIAEREP